MISYLGSIIKGVGNYDGEVRQEDAARSGDFIAAKSRHSRREEVVKKQLSNG